jgi:hypothetical protein
MKEIRKQKKTKEEKRKKYEKGFEATFWPRTKSGLWPI